jgi:hypothetical protein
VPENGDIGVGEDGGNLGPGQSLVHEPLRVNEAGLGRYQRGGRPLGAGPFPPIFKKLVNGGDTWYLRPQKPLSEEGDPELLSIGICAVKRECIGMGNSAAAILMSR